MKLFHLVWFQKQGAIPIHSVLLLLCLFFPSFTLPCRRRIQRKIIRPLKRQTPLTSNSSIHLVGRLYLTAIQYLEQKSRIVTLGSLAEYIGTASVNTQMLENSLFMP